MKCHIPGLLGLVVIALASTALAQTSTYNKNLEPLLPIIGKWTTEITLWQDTAGVGKKGEKVSSVGIYKWTENGNAIVLTVEQTVDGKSVNVTNGLIVWDALQKKIIGLDAYIGGGIYQYEVQVQKDKIVLRGHGSTAEGARTETTVEYTNLSTDSFTGQFIGQREGDKQLPDSPRYTLTRAKE